MGHPFKEEIVFLEQLAAKQDHIGNALGYRFKNNTQRDQCRAALNTLIKANKDYSEYRAGSTGNTKYVSMFLPIEYDEGRLVGTRLEVQFTNDSLGGFITIEMTRASVTCMMRKG